MNATTDWDIDKNTLLAERIASIFEEGIAVTGRVAYFIETTFGCYTAGTISPILSDLENVETETLLELLFYPDETIQMTMEILLEKAEYTDADIGGIIAMLMRTLPRATLRVPAAQRDAMEEIGIDVPASALHALIKRLNITRRIEPRVADALACCLKARPDILRARVQLRNARFIFSEPVTDFLCRLIEKTCQLPGFFRQAFAFIVDFLDETNPRTDIYPALMEKKRTFRRMIRQAMTTEIALQENPPEVMMMKGQAILCIDAEDTRGQIDLIDRIAILVFGTTDASIYSDPVALSAAVRMD